jgi:hypothetical protein
LLKSWRSISPSGRTSSKLSFQTGATRTDNLIDVDGGIGTLFVYAGKGRRELPNSTFLLDGAVEPMGKAGTFAGSTSSPRCRALRFISTPSTFHAGVCSKSWRPRYSPVFLSYRNRRPSHPMSPMRSRA